MHGVTQPAERWQRLSVRKPIGALKYERCRMVTIKDVPRHDEPGRSPQAIET